jgi:hypothetical protein
MKTDRLPYGGMLIMTVVTLALGGLTVFDASKSDWLRLGVYAAVVSMSYGVGWTGGRDTERRASGSLDDS